MGLIHRHQPNIDNQLHQTILIGSSLARCEFRLGVVDSKCTSGHRYHSLHRFCYTLAQPLLYVYANNWTITLVPASIKFTFALNIFSNRISRIKTNKYSLGEKIIIKYIVAIFALRPHVSSK
jgi:hypothetical protein